jgi:hypothetical protein
MRRLYIGPLVDGRNRGGLDLKQDSSSKMGFAAAILLLALMTLLRQDSRLTLVPLAVRPIRSYARIPSTVKLLIGHHSGTNGSVTDR